MRLRPAVTVVISFGLALAAPASAHIGARVSHQPPPSRLVQGPRVELGTVSAVRHRANAQPKANQGAQQLTYHGGLQGHGGVIHHPKVYLVFWGSQWSKTDPYAAYETSFFKGLYGAGDTWTGIQHEFCDGVKTGAVWCPDGAPRVGAPKGGSVLKGVWFDDSAPAIPTDLIVSAGVTPDTVAQEAVKAAAHFGNTTSKKNKDVQYIINAPSHFWSLGFGAVYCAYHSYVDSDYGPLPYTNMPYNTDFGLDCGQNAVNAGSDGKYDGVSIVVGHEYIETITDPYPNSGWDADDGENADKCAWATEGPGAMADLHLRTGTFAVQGSWSNLANNGSGGCVIHG